MILNILEDLHLKSASQLDGDRMKEKITLYMETTKKEPEQTLAEIQKLLKNHITLVNDTIKIFDW